MRKHLKNKMDKYMNAFKNDIIQWVTKTQSGTTNEGSNCLGMSDTNLSNFTKFVNNYESFNDVTVTAKKTHVGIGICNARRADGEQCTRRIQCNTTDTKSSKFCGTHYKGIPYGEIENQVVQSVISKKCVYVVNINGIGYYVDDKDNIYKTEDVYNNVNNPEIIAIRTKSEKGEYGITYL